MLIPANSGLSYSFNLKVSFKKRPPLCPSPTDIWVYGGGSAGTFIHLIPCYRSIVHGGGGRAGGRGGGEGAGGEERGEREGRIEEGGGKEMGKRGKGGGPAYCTLFPDILTLFYFLSCTPPARLNKDPFAWFSLNLLLSSTSCGSSAKAVPSAGFHESDCLNPTHRDGSPRAAAHSLATLGLSHVGSGSWSPGPSSWLTHICWSTPSRS